eukprot:GFUD01020069.1.p1 GENE.GFUD01020069.1~~GFUD01020069.1.p1  ORF type:complete len:586 (-),score=220.57 GFUD01020069.1:538-2217(-)
MERRTEAKSKYIRVFTKLKKQTEKKQTATISQSIKQMKQTWKDLEEAHSNYMKEVPSTENEDEVTRLAEEFGDLESNMEDVIANAAKLSIGREEETRGSAKAKFEQAYDQLKEKVQNWEKANISKIIKQVKVAWNNFEKAHISYVKEVDSSGKEDEASQFVDEFGELESDKEDIIAKADELANKEEEVFEEFSEDPPEDAKEKDKYVKNKDSAAFGPTSPQKRKEKIMAEPLYKNEEDSNEAGEAESAEKAEVKGGKKNKSGLKPKPKSKVNTDDEGNAADSNEEEEGESDGQTESVEEAEEAEDKREKKFFLKKTRSKLKGMAKSVMAKSSAENVQLTVQDTLGKITVSKDQFARFQVLLKDQLVDNWEETSESKVFQGVQVEKYTEFLELFKTSTGIDKKVYAEFKAMEFTDRMDDKVKSFTCKGSNNSGKYGIYMAVKRPQENKIDVAYAMYSYKAKFTGNSSAEPNNYKIWKAEKDAKTGLYRLTTPVVENILTGKLMSPNRNFTVGDMNELTENFIVAKALQAFAHYGVIPKVTWAEDVPKVDQESKLQIEEVP